MRYNALASLALAATLAFAAPASAADWSENVATCAAAAEAQGIVAPGARAKFLSGKGAAIKTISIELTEQSGEKVTAVCKVRRGEVTEIEATA